MVDKLNYSLSLLFRNPPVLVQSVEAEHILLHYGGIGLVLRLDQQLDLLLVRIVQGNQILRILRSPLHQLSLLIIISFFLFEILLILLIQLPKGGLVFEWLVESRLTEDVVDLN